jgi:hypothetical protein
MCFTLAVFAGRDLSWLVLEDRGRLAPSFVRQLLLPLVVSGRIEGFLGREGGAITSG